MLSILFWKNIALSRLQCGQGNHTGDLFFKRLLFTSYGNLGFLKRWLVLRFKDGFLGEKTKNKKHLENSNLTGSPYCCPHLSFNSHQLPSFTDFSWLLVLSLVLKRACLKKKKKGQGKVNIGGLKDWNKSLLRVFLFFYFF